MSPITFSTLEGLQHERVASDSGSSFGSEASTRSATPVAEEGSTGPLYTTTTYRVGSNFEICVKRVTHESSPFQSFELYFTGTGVSKLILKSTKVNYEREFTYNENEIVPENIVWLTERSNTVNLLKIKIPKRPNGPTRAEILSRRRQKRQEKKKRNATGMQRRLPAGASEPMSTEEALYECVELHVRREAQELAA